MAVTDELRSACAEVARRAAHVRIDHEAIAPYAAALPLGQPLPTDPQAHLLEGPKELLAAFWTTLDAINFGSGWFPTLRKRDGRSGYFTIATAIRERFVASGPWTAAELADMEVADIAAVLGQDPDHELMHLFASSLRDLGSNLIADHGSSFSSLIDSADGSAVALIESLSRWRCFSDTAHYGELKVQFLKRAQILAADLARGQVADFHDLEGLTMFADNLVPHVLRLDGVLSFTPDLTARIEREDLLEHGSPEEVEIRACALHAIEQIVAARGTTIAMDVDELLWRRGQDPRYKATPRHRCRCTAY